MASFYKKLCLLAILIITSIHGSYAQKTIFDVQSYPDTFIILVNKNPVGKTPIKFEVDFNFNKYFIYEVRLCKKGSPDSVIKYNSYPGSEVNINIKGAPLKVITSTLKKKIDELTLYFAFSKILVDIPEGSEIGSIGTGYSKRVYKWTYDDVISTSEYNRMAEREMNKAGYKTVTENKLFDEQTEQKDPDLLVGGNLKDIKIASDGKARSQASINLNIEWQVFNRKRGKVILKIESVGYASCSPEEIDRGIKDAFKNAFDKFINTDTFYNSVQNFGSKFTGNSKIKPIAIKKIQPKLYKERSEMIAECLKSVLTIKTELGHGSGFIISAEGYIVTNYHVINGAKEINAIFDGGFSLPATVFSFDENNDVALLKIQGGGFKALPIGNSDSLAIGADVVAMGTPASLDLSQTVTKGMVSSKRDFEGHEYLQTDVSVNPGNSGGPLLNMKGEVTGIISRGIRTAQGLNFAIPSRVLMSTLKITYEQ